MPWMETFWRHFGVLGSVLGTRGPPGDPQRGQVEKVTEKVVRGSCPGPPNFTKIRENLKEIEGPSASRSRHAILMAKVSKSGRLDVAKPK